MFLGAGFSHAAGVPLMGQFVERMWEFAAKEATAGVKLSDADAEIFRNAMNVFAELDTFHGRAEFDDRNIEDVLSILSFNALSGEPGSTRNLGEVNRAIGRTIELTCEVKHPGLPPDEVYTVVEDGPRGYGTMWQRLFERLSDGEELPIIITTNYDLVLERSLFQTLISTHFDGQANTLPFDQITLRYHSRNVDALRYDVDYHQFRKWTNEMPAPVRGTVLKASQTVSDQNLDITVLKLHGSLNFPLRKPELPYDSSSLNPVAAVDDPSILPPIFNKGPGRNAEPVWRQALKALREAKRLTFVGYSLPRTDIYMQYFIKAALGPNRDLDRIAFLDPVLYEGSERTQDMENRYRACFSPQIQKRLSFRPGTPGEYADEGKLSHLLQLLKYKPDSLLF